MSRLWDEYMRATEPDATPPQDDTAAAEELRQILAALDQGKYLGRFGVDGALVDILELFVSKAEVERAIGLDENTPIYEDPSSVRQYSEAGRNRLRREIRAALGLKGGDA